MRSRWALLAAGLLLCGGLICLIIGTRDREPTNNGRPLGEWVRRYGDPDTKQEATDAIVCIVTNQTSTLVKLLDYDTGPREASQIRRIEMLPRFLYTTPFVYRWMFTEDKRAFRATDALTAFQIAGAHGERAVPALTSLMLTASSRQAAMRAANALAYVGGPGCVTLVMNATNPASPARLQAIEALPRARSRPEEARKVIFAALTDPNPRVRQVATNAVRRYWPER